MKLLSVSIDPTVADPRSSVAGRQCAYYAGHEVDILVLATGEYKLVDLAPGIRVYVAGGRSKINTLIKGLSLIRHWRHDRKYDAVTAQDALFSGMLGYLAGHRFQAPFIVQLHGDYLDNPLWIRQRRINTILNPIGKWIVRHSDGVRCVSGRLRGQVIKGFDVKEDRVASLPICPDLSIFSPAGDKYPGGPRLLFVGRLIEEKSPMLFCDVAIALMKKQADLNAVIIGQGNLESAMRSRFDVEGLERRVTFTGQLSSIELAVWYRSSVCLIHTAAWEGWGVPMIESMACGCPVVSVDSGCAGEAVRNDENGRVVPVDDLEGLIRGTGRLLDDQAERERMSKNAVQEAAKWSFEASVKNQVAFIQRIIADYEHTYHRGGRTGRD